MGGKHSHSHYNADPKMKVWVTNSDWAKLLQYCREAKPNEIMGLAYIEPVEGGFRLYDPFILKQKVGPANCEFDRKEFAKFLATGDDIGKVKCLWHSHVEMSAFFSGCDRETSNGLATIGKSMGGSNSWFFSLVLNVKGEYQAKVDMYKPFEASLPCEIEQYHDDHEAIAEEVKTLVEGPAPTQYSYGGRGYSSLDDLGHLAQEGFGEEWSVVARRDSADTARKESASESPSTNTPAKDESEFDEVFQCIKSAPVVTTYPKTEEKKGEEKGDDKADGAGSGGK